MGDTYGIWPNDSGIPPAPQMSFVLFMDGFAHYEHLEDKWTTFYGGIGIEENAGCWYDIPSIIDDHEYTKENNPANALYIPGTYYPGDAAPYVEMDLTDHLARTRIIVSMNFKAEEFTGIPFFRAYDENHNPLYGYGFTPDGTPFSFWGASPTTSNMLFATSGSMYTHPNMWINIRVGIRLAVDYGEMSVPGWAGLRMDVNQHKHTAGFGMLYPVSTDDLKIRYVRLSTAGKNTRVSDLICLRRSMINEANCVHTLWPKEGVGYDSLDDNPPSKGSTVEATPCCSGHTYLFTEDQGGGESHTEADIVQEMTGVEYQAYGTVQVNALAKGEAWAHGCFSKYPGTSGVQFDGDSNRLNPEDRDHWHCDITQVCHWHRYKRLLWRPGTFRSQMLGFAAMQEAPPVTTGAPTTGGPTTAPPTTITTSVPGETIVDWIGWYDITHYLTPPGTWYNEAARSSNCMYMRVTRSEYVNLIPMAVANNWPYVVLYARERDDDGTPHIAESVAAAQQVVAAGLNLVAMVLTDEADLGPEYPHGLNMTDYLNQEYNLYRTAMDAAGLSSVPIATTNWSCAADPVQTLTWDQRIAAWGVPITDIHMTDGWYSGDSTSLHLVKSRYESWLAAMEAANGALPIINVIKAWSKVVGDTLDLEDISPTWVERQLLVVAGLESVTYHWVNPGTGEEADVTVEPLPTSQQGNILLYKMDSTLSGDTDYAGGNRPDIVDKVREIALPQGWTIV